MTHGSTETSQNTPDLLETARPRLEHEHESTTGSPSHHRPHLISSDGGASTSQAQQPFSEAPCRRSEDSALSMPAPDAAGPLRFSTPPPPPPSSLLSAFASSSSTNSLLVLGLPISPLSPRAPPLTEPKGGGPRGRLNAHFHQRQLSSEAPPSILPRSSSAEGDALGSSNSRSLQEPCTSEATSTLLFSSFQPPLGGPALDPTDGATSSHSEIHLTSSLGRPPLPSHLHHSEICPLISLACHELPLPVCLWITLTAYCHPTLCRNIYKHGAHMSLYHSPPRPDFSPLVCVLFD